MIRYTILNFTRLGDLLQTQSTIAALKKQGNNYVSLVCLESFASAAHFIEELDDIRIFTGASILKDIHTDWRQALQSMDTWINEYYDAYPFDVVLNLIPSMPCRLFAQLLSRKGKHIRLEGFGLDSFGFGENTSIWTSYIQAVTQERGCSPYNLVDGFRSMLSLAPEPFKLRKPNTIKQNEAHTLLDVARQNILKQFPSIHASTCRFVAFQLGASAESRQWNPQNFAELGKILWETRQIIPILLGAQSELAITERYRQHSQTLGINTPFINLCGKTSLEELGAILCKVDALVSNDTGTLHLAVGLGTPVLGIYLATAQVWDTGPYGKGHLCLEPRLDCHPCAFQTPCPHDFKCRQYITAQNVYDALSLLLDNRTHNKESVSKMQALPVISNSARIWQAYFDEDGFISYKSLSGDETSDRSLWMACQRLFYKNLIHSMESVANKDMPDLNIEKPLKQHMAQKYSTEALAHLKNNTFITNNIDFIDRLLSFILLAKEQASMLNIRPSVKLQENFFTTIQRIELYLKPNTSFTPLYLLWKNLLQENGSSMEKLVHFFDTLHKELLDFVDYLRLSSK